MKSYPIPALAVAILSPFLISQSSADSVVPAIAEYKFTAVDSKTINAQEKLPVWAGAAKNEGGEIDSVNEYWHAAASLPEGEGKLVVDLYREILQQDLALSLTYHTTPGSDISVQLLDDTGKTVAVDLFQNVVAMGKEAQTDTFVVPLQKYPHASKLAIRRVKGDVKIIGFVLYPVVGEIKAEVQSHAEIASLFGDPLSDKNSLKDALAFYAPRNAAKATELQRKLTGIPGAPAFDFSLVKPAAHGVMLSSAQGEQFCGHQLESFRKGSDGALTCSEPAWINLYRTEGKSFRLSGEVMLAPKGFPGGLSDAPQGFALFLREFDSLHRYNANSVGMRVKRRLLEGEKIQQFARPFVFKTLERGTWHRFAAEVHPNLISFSLGNQIGMIRGPLAIDGANKIVLSPGAKLRGLQLKILP